MSTAHTTEAHTEPAAPASKAERKVDISLAHYGASHQPPHNALFHYFAIPLIMFSLIGLMFSLHPTMAYGFMVASLVHCACLSLVFFTVMLAGSRATVALLFGLGRALLPINVVVFVGAWVMQFAPHKIEGKKPSFFEDFQYLWVGPLFVLSRLFGRLGPSW